MTSRKDKLASLREAIAKIDVASASASTEEVANESSPRGAKGSKVGAESAGPTFEEAKQKAYDLLSRRPHTIRELREKLASRDFSQSIIDAVIERVLELRYIREDEIAERRALHLAGKGRGPLHIRKKLRGAGLSDADINAGLEACEREADWIERAASWARKRGLEQKLRTTADRQKLYAKLARRGFPSSIARSVVFDQLSPENWT